MSEKLDDLVIAQLATIVAKRPLVLSENHAVPTRSRLKQVSAISDISRKRSGLFVFRVKSIANPRRSGANYLDKLDLVIKPSIVSKHYDM